MLIGITGHLSGIGKELANIFKSQGHEVIGFSRQNGYNIQIQNSILYDIDPCDIFINNAQYNFAQTELLIKMYERWNGCYDKWIINIGSISSSFPISVNEEDELYRIQKKSLEEAFQQLRFKDTGPKLTLVKPGAVKTNGETIGADPKHFAQSMFNILFDNNLHISELTLEPPLRISQYED